MGRRATAQEDTELDGCDVEITEADAVSDDDLDAVVLFADVDVNDPAAVAARVDEWKGVLS